MRRIGGMFHAPGTHARWWACCPHILGTHRSCPGDTQKPSWACGTYPGQCMSQSRIQDTFCTQNVSDASGVCSMPQGDVLDSGHTAPTSWEHAKAIPGM